MINKWYCWLIYLITNRSQRHPARTHIPQKAMNAQKLTVAQINDNARIDEERARIADLYPEAAYGGDGPWNDYGGDYPGHAPWTPEMGKITVPAAQPAADPNDADEIHF